MKPAGWWPGLRRSVSCSLAQVVAGLAPQMGWTGTRAELVRNHRRSAECWLDAATLDALATGFNAEIDDFLPARTGPGHPPLLSDGEAITLAVFQMLLRLPNDRGPPQPG